MRLFLILWVLPISLMATWYGLSAYDVNLGTTILSRPMHDAVLSLYANILGVDVGVIPGLLLNALIVDTALVVAIMAFRHRVKLRAWWNARDTRQGGATA
ncbi:DUF6105 family protein [Rhizobiaceae bacterium]|nr:DUF6105 family protein [Rhizobiaceae bacterium]